ncbi:MAG: P-II family nitrogen regulator [Nitrosopumilaceae archaeon]
MKKIEAIIRETRFQNVKTALTKMGVKGMTTYPVRGRGDQVGEGADVDVGYGGSEQEVFEDGLVPKRKIEIVCVEEEVNKIVNSIAINASTGQTGDGKIFVSDISDVIRIRTEERGQVAI